MPSESAHDELVDLAFAVCDGEASDEQIGRVEELLAGDPAARLLYLQCLELHFDIGCRASMAANRQPSVIEHQEPFVPPIILDLSPASPLHSSVSSLRWAAFCSRTPPRRSFWASPR